MSWYSLVETSLSELFSDSVRYFLHFLISLSFLIIFLALRTLIGMFFYLEREDETSS
jgi:hypothetical protein